MQYVTVGIIFVILVSNSKQRLGLTIVERAARAPCPTYIQKTVELGTG